MTDAKQSERKKRGGGWESEIDDIENEGLRIGGEARIVRAYEPMRVLGTHPDGSPKVVRLAKAEPDFAGPIAGGRHVAFDAKRTQSHLLSLPDPAKVGARTKDGKKVSNWYHQIVALSSITSLGGIGFLYVLRDDMQNPFNRERYVLPVRRGLVAGRDPRVDRSIILDECEAYRVKRVKVWYDVVLSNLEFWQ